MCAFIKFHIYTIESVRKTNNVKRAAFQTLQSAFLTGLNMLYSEKKDCARSKKGQGPL